MANILVLKDKKDNHYQIKYDNDGPYSIGSTSDIPLETVVKKLQINNPHAVIEVEG